MLAINLHSLFLPPDLTSQVPGLQLDGFSWLARYLHTEVLQVTVCDLPCSKRPGCLTSLLCWLWTWTLFCILFLPLRKRSLETEWLCRMLCIEIWTQSLGHNVVAYSQRSLSSVILLPVWACHFLTLKWSLFLCHPPWVWAGLGLFWPTEHVSSQVLRRAGSFRFLTLVSQLPCTCAYLETTVL